MIETKCYQITYNWRQEVQRVGELKVGGVKFDTYTLGENGVTEIREAGERHYTVFFKEGNRVEIFNPNTVSHELASNIGEIK